MGLFRNIFKRKKKRCALKDVPAAPPPNMDVHRETVQVHHEFMRRMALLGQDASELRLALAKRTLENVHRRM